MIDESNFIVRMSGRDNNKFYIDYSGTYKIIELSKIVGIDAPTIREKYLANGAVYEESLDVYYFNSLDKAHQTINDVLKMAKGNEKGRLVFLTEAEIEFIRMALIREGISSIHMSNKVKDAIFKKLNA